MTFIEFIGLIISLVALALVSARRAREERKRRENPELWEQEQAQRRRTLQETLREMHIEIENGPAIDRVVSGEDQEMEDDFDEEEDEPAPSALVMKEPLRRTPNRMVQRTYAMPFKLNRFRQVRPIDQRRLTSALQLRRIGRDVVSRDMSSDMLQRDAYTQTRATSPSVAQKLLSRLNKPSDMVLFYTIWEKPKGLQ